MNYIKSPFTISEFALTLSPTQKKIASKSWKYHIETKRAIGQIFKLLGVYQE